MTFSPKIAPDRRIKLSNLSPMCDFIQRVLMQS